MHDGRERRELLLAVWFPSRKLTHKLMQSLLVYITYIARAPDKLCTDWWVGNQSSVTVTTNKPQRLDVKHTTQNIKTMDIISHHSGDPSHLSVPIHVGMMCISRWNIYKCGTLPRARSQLAKHQWPCPSNPISWINKCSQQLLPVLMSSAEWPRRQHMARIPLSGRCFII